MPDSFSTFQAELEGSDANKLMALCHEISMPGEARDFIRGFVPHADFSAIDPFFNGLFSEDGDDAAGSVIEWGKESHGLPALSAFLLAALRTKEMYRELGIGDDVYTDTVKVFTRFSGEHLASFMCYGFDRGWWTWRHLGCKLFRLGELEFEMRKLDGDMMKILGTDVPRALSVHIPSDAVITRDELNRSYEMAKDFFPRFFPGFDYKIMYCHTWLLAPALKELLPTASRILEFQKDYQIIQVSEDDDSFMRWVFKRSYERTEDLPEETSLMRAIKARLLAGGKVGGALGALRL